MAAFTSSDLIPKIDQPMNNPGVFDAHKWLPERLIWFLAEDRFSPFARTRSITPGLDRRIVS